MAKAQDKKRLLYLVHRIPYPPNKGDKIRSFNMLKHFARDYQIYLGAFIDDPNDQQYVEDVKNYCKDVCLLPINPFNRRITSLTGLLTNAPLTLHYYASAAMQHWVDKVMSEQEIDAVVVFSSPMSQFVEKYQEAELVRVADFVDVDSDKWRQYARYKSWPVSWIYGREARTLLAYERRIASIFDATVLVSEDEAALFRQLAPEVESKVHGISNGVDTEYFSPVHDYINPYSGTGPFLVFTGAMDYWANVDAVCWFTDNVFPLIRASLENTEFYIVGSRPSNEVLALRQYQGVTVTGAVNDIRPYIAYANAAVAPMRIARGVQNKVLEAMAMAKPVLATQEAAEGIQAEYGKDLVVTTGEEELAQAIVTLLRREPVDNAMGLAARECVIKNYSWTHNLSFFNRLLSRGVERSQEAHNKCSDAGVSLG